MISMLLHNGSCSRLLMKKQRRKLIGKHLESISLMTFALIIGGVVMWAVDALFSTRNRSGDVEDVSVRQAVWIGLCQTLSAVFPGTSRSMVTIAAGESAGLSRGT